MFISQPIRKYILVAFAALFLFTAGTSLYIHYVQNATKETVFLKIAEQQTQLSVIAELTATDGADTVVAEIIRDCSPENRARFDTQLSKLDSLRASELTEIEQLFNACGNFFSERKAVMTARLKREYEVYTDLVDILKKIDERADVTLYKTEGWSNLVAMETKRSQLSSRLVDIQGAVIRELRSGVAIQSEELQATLVEAQKIKVELLDLSEEINHNRNALHNI
jgi:hypothetical protein